MGGANTAAKMTMKRAVASRHRETQRVSTNARPRFKMRAHLLLMRRIYLCFHLHHNFIALIFSALPFGGDVSTPSHSQYGSQKGVGIWLESAVHQQVVKGIVPLHQEAYESHHHLNRNLAKNVVGHDVGAELSGRPQEIFLKNGFDMNEHGRSFQGGGHRCSMSTQYVLCCIVVRCELKVYCAESYFHTMKNGQPTQRKVFRDLVMSQCT